MMRVIYLGIVIGVLAAVVVVAVLWAKRTIAEIRKGMKL